ncbi:formylglycine-generating enzyme family protein [bacterium]
MRNYNIRTCFWMIALSMVQFFACIRERGIDPEYEEMNLDWAFVEGGVFQMGIEGSEKSPIHRVKLSSFFIGKYEVTNTQYAEFLNVYASDTVKTGEFQGEKIVYPYHWGVQKPDSLWAPVPGYEMHPVLNLPWIGAVTFCKFYGWRLPTEAEWEFAAKGGVKSQGFIFSGSDSVDEVGWTHELSGNHPHPIGLLTPNELGIYDMTGNLWEWVWDWYDVYSHEAQVNPAGPDSGKNHVFRGGSWLSSDLHSRNAYRGGSGIDYHGISHNGFRCVKDE